MNKNKIDGRQLLSDFQFITGYSKFREDLGRKESWEESVDRVIDMHINKYKKEIEKKPKLKEYIEYARQAYYDKLVLASQRSLQYGGEPTLRKNMRIYNCATTYIDRVRAFQEIMYMLMMGCGVGFSVQTKHIQKLPKLHQRTKGVKTYIIPDTSEGWADAFGVLISSYTPDHYKTDFQEYQGYRVYFDYSQIREEGAFITGGFKAPGPKGLKTSIEKVENLLDSALKENGENETIFKSILAYDIIMHMSDAVLSGGLRRSATICLFSIEDEDMMKAKTGDWYIKNPQRGRSNNSVALIKDKITKEEFDKIMESTKQYGEPGFVFLDDEDIIYNPCVEAGMMPKHYKTGESGWQVCNLTEGNGKLVTSREDFFRMCKAQSIIGTLQSGFTDVGYLTNVSKEIIEHEALLGCSITGWMDNPDILFQEEMLKEGAKLILDINEEVANMIGVNPTARATVVKPAGNSSVVLGTTSGIHGEHSRRYIRHKQMNKMDEFAQHLHLINPDMFEDSVWSANKSDWVVSFPIEASPKAKFKSELEGVKQLEYVLKVQQSWIEAGTRLERCVHPKLRHNVSNTINVDNWGEVADYIFENRKYLAGVSLLSSSGDKDYNQAPFTAVFTSKEMLKEYGDSVVFASGLIVDGLQAFDNNLWLACDTALGFGIKLSYAKEEVEEFIKNTPLRVLWSYLGLSNRVINKLVKHNEYPSTSDIKAYLDEKLISDTFNGANKKDWVRRFKQFSNKYQKGDLKRTSYLLKDVYNWHKWMKINNNIEDVDWLSLDVKPTYTDVDTMGATACGGGACEI